MKALDVLGLDHVAQKIYDLIGSGGSANYIIEEGTSGIWTYRKWASGIMEAWGNTSASVAMTNPIQNTYYGNTSISISGLGFTTLQSVHVTGQASGSYFGTKLESYNTSQITVSSRSSASYTNTINFSFEIKGLWRAFTPSVSRAVYNLGDLKVGSLEVPATISANATTWVTATIPDGRTLVCPAGYYYYGDNNVNCTVYAFRQINDTQIQFAIRNWASAQAPLTLAVSYIYV